jgi:hypothetical protein
MTATVVVTSDRLHCHSNSIFRALCAGATGLQQSSSALPEFWQQSLIPAQQFQHMTHCAPAAALAINHNIMICAAAHAAHWQCSSSEKPTAGEVINKIANVTVTGML